MFCKVFYVLYSTKSDWPLQDRQNQTLIDFAALSDTPMQSPWNHSEQLSHPLTETDSVITFHIFLLYSVIIFNKSGFVHHETVDVWSPADTVDWSIRAFHGDCSFSFHTLRIILGSCCLLSLTNRQTGTSEHQQNLKKKRFYGLPSRFGTCRPAQFCCNNEKMWTFLKSIFNINETLNKGNKDPFKSQKPIR